MDKESKIVETLNIAERISDVTPEDELISRLKQIPLNYLFQIRSVSRQMLIGAAASIALLLCLNFYTVAKEKRERSASLELKSDSSETYFDYLKNY